MSEKDWHLGVQGIVSAADHSALVQFLLEREGEETIRWSLPGEKAREHAQLVIEAAANATYEQAFVQWLIEEQKVDEETAVRTLALFRIWRSDKWGQPPIEDWRPPDGG